MMLSANCERSINTKRVWEFFPSRLFLFRPAALPLESIENSVPCSACGGGALN